MNWAPRKEKGVLKGDFTATKGNNAAFQSTKTYLNFYKKNTCRVSTSQKIDHRSAATKKFSLWIYSACWAQCSGGMSTRRNGGQYIQITSILTSCLEMVTFEPTITFLDTSSIVFWIWENERSYLTTSFCADFWCVNDMNAIKGWVEEFEKCKQRIFEYFDLVPDFIFNVCQLFKNSEQLTELLCYGWTGEKNIVLQKTIFMLPSWM